MKHWLVGLFGLLLVLLVHFWVPVTAQLPEGSSSGAVELVRQGKARYQAGQFQEAIAFLDRAARGYAAAGNQLDRARTLSYLALAYRQLGDWENAEMAIESSFSLLNSNGDTPGEIQALALVTQTRGHLQLARGDAEGAARSWEDAAQLYDRIGDEAAAIGTRINYLQALQTLGFYRRAERVLKGLEAQLAQQPHSVQVAGWLSLGNTLRAIGQFDRAKDFLEHSADIAESPQQKNAAWLSLGNTIREQANRKRDRQDTNYRHRLPGYCRRLPLSENISSELETEYEEAERRYLAVSSSSATDSLKIQAELNLLGMKLDIYEVPSPELVRSLPSRLDRLPLSRTSLYAKVNFARSSLCLQQMGENESIEELQTIDSLVRTDRIEALLNSIVREAGSLGDNRVRAYALGYLGQLYEYNLQESRAIELTQKALDLARSIQAPEIVYQWQWQKGRLLEKLEDRQGAIAAYKNAVESVSLVRGDLQAIESDTQFSFRDNVEPIYRELVSLLLLNSTPDNENLRNGREKINELQVAALEDYLRCDLRKIETTTFEEVSYEDKSTTALITPIILEDRLEVILTLPDDSVERYTQQNQINYKQVEEKLENLRDALNQTPTVPESKKFGKEVYDWLITPGKQVLESYSIDTLVFNLDRSFQVVPMAALWDSIDGQYLIEKYAISLTLDGNIPTSTKPNNIPALIAGVAIEPEYLGFGKLDHVVDEVEKIESIISNSDVLLDREFTNQNFSEFVESNSYSIIHLATHGKFSSNPDDTFLVTMPDNESSRQEENTDRNIDLNELGSLLGNQPESRLELFVLSACETAEGDKWANLGLGGFAIQSGARSTLATLWSIPDASTPTVMKRFYQELFESERKVSKAKALQIVQLEFLKKKHNDEPIYSTQEWSSYILIGNWQSFFSL